MKKIPVNIFSGFLGSGKTTAIIKLLNDKISEDQWAVIINEFGKVSIDSQTLRASSDAGNIFEVVGGCICCSAKGYFQENLEQIISIGTYSRIIIEPSGLGGIEMVSEIVASSEVLKLMPVICLVDILGVENRRLQSLPIYSTQILKADIIVLTKCDLLENEATEVELIEKFKSLYPDKRCYLNDNDANFWLSLLDINDLIPKEESKFRMILAGNHQLTADNYQVINYSFEADTIFSTQKLVRFFHNHPAIIRGKGNLHTEKGWMLVNFTLSGCIFESCQDKESGEIVLITEKQKFDLFQSLEEKIKNTTI